MKRLIVLPVVVYVLLRWLLSLLGLAEKSILWTTGTTGDGTTTYTEAEATAFWGYWFTPNSTITSPHASAGVFAGAGGELAVTGASSPVSVATGAAIVEGYPYHNTAAVTVAIPTPAGSTRIDRIVLRASHGATRTVRITRIAGTEGAGAPALTQVAGTTWDIPLAQVSITTGGVITLTDQRSFVHVATRVDKSNVDGMTAGYIPFADANGRLTQDTSGGPYFDSANNRLALGTASPSVDLDIQALAASIRALSTSDSDGPALLLQNNTGSPTYLGAVNYVNAGGAVRGQVAYDASAEGLALSVAGAEKARLTSTGLGIGDATPDYALDVVGQIEVSPASALPPFVLGANANGQRVDGLAADEIDTLSFQRQGGSATDWSAPGTSNHTPATMRMQAGSRQISGYGTAASGSFTINFPVSFAQPPIVLVSTVGIGSALIIASTSSPSTSGVLITWNTRNGSSVSDPLDFNWMAIGPE